MVCSLNPNLVLIGFMGTGKTTVGRRCARFLGFRFVDTDARIVRRVGTSIPEIFAREGEGVFREMEARAVREVAGYVHVVIATGGGVVLNPENVRLLRASGILIWLKVAPEEILRRCRDRSTRPLLADADDPLERIRAMLNQRTPFYEAAADTSVDATGLTHEMTTRLVLEAYRTHAAQWRGTREECEESS